MVPNRKIVGEILHNYGKTRQISLTVGVAYDAGIKLAIATSKAILEQNPRVQQKISSRSRSRRSGSSAGRREKRRFLNAEWQCECEVRKGELKQGGGELSRAQL